MSEILDNNTKNIKSADGSKAKYCRYFWNGIVSLKQDGSMNYFCFYMNKENINKLKKSV